MARLSVMSLEDWSKVEVEEIRKRWTERRRKIEEVEKRKKEIEDKIEIRKKKKEEKRKRAIRERRCFVCGIFGYMACYCRNRGEEKKGSTQMPLNKFEVLRDRVMQRGEGSGREIGKNRREILREEREKKGKKMTAQKKGQEKKKEKQGEDETDEEKRKEGQ